jgi:hypothetical protein
MLVWHSLGHTVLSTPVCTVLSLNISLGLPTLVGVSPWCQLGQLFRPSMGHATWLNTCITWRDHLLQMQTMLGELVEI